MSGDFQPDWAQPEVSEPGASEDQVEESALPPRLQRRTSSRGNGTRPAQFDVLPGEPGYDERLDPNHPNYRYRGLAATQSSGTRTAARNAAAARRVRVSAMMVQGLTYQQIVERLLAEGIHATYIIVAQDAIKIRKEWKDARVMDVDDLVELQRQRLEAMHSAIWEQAMVEQDLFAVDRLLRINESLRRLLGLDKITKLGGGEDQDAMLNRMEERLGLLAERLQQGESLEDEAPASDGETDGDENPLAS